MDSGSSDAGKKVVFERRWRHGGVARSAKALDLPCNLKKAMPCCGGKGYSLGIRSGVPHAFASLCTCVTSCTACCGLARQMVGNDSRPCLTPAPNVVVNLLNAAHIPARYADATVDRFTNLGGNARDVLAQINRWKKGFKASGERGLIIEGPVGVGKTYLLAALAKEFAERGMSVRFTDFFQLLNDIKAGFTDGKADAAQLAPLIDVDVLFIDELGKGRNNDWELTILDQLVCGRYNQSKAIVASTNYRLKGRGYEVNAELDRDPGGASGQFAGDRFTTLEQRIGPRIFSRLREMTAFTELTGPDFRRKGDLG